LSAEKFQKCFRKELNFDVSPRVDMSEFNPRARPQHENTREIKHANEVKAYDPEIRIPL
jgi:hypothetical protein